jgi:hypothetical protein
MMLPISEALADPNLLGAGLGPIDSWKTWLVVLKAAFAEKLTDEERALFAQVAGDRAPPTRRVRDLWCGPIGRRSGKSRMASAVAVHIAALTDHSKRLAPGETGCVSVIAASREQAGTVYGYVRGFLEASPLLAGQIEGMTANEIRLKGNIEIEVTANSYRTVRGRSLLAVVGDEISFWRDESTAMPDVETYRAVLPSLVASGGMFIGISTGYRRVGLLYQKHRDHYGRDGDDVLAICGPTELFNKTIDAGLIARAREEDPESASAEWDGGFRRDIAAFLTDEDIDAATDHDRPLELPPRPGVRYRAMVDPSGGRHDAYCVAIGHHEGTRSEGRFVLDVVRGVWPPFDPRETTRAFAGLLRDYSLTEVSGDAYAAEWVEGAFRDAGIKYVRSEKPKSQLYLEAQPLFSRGAILLPNHPTLLRELRLLERRTHRSGRDTVDHGLRGHDDHANACLGCAAIAMKRGYISDMSWVCDDNEVADLRLAERQRYATYVARGGF